VDEYEIDLVTFARDWRGLGQSDATLRTYLNILRRFSRSDHAAPGKRASYEQAREFIRSEGDRSAHARAFAWRALVAFDKWYSIEYRVERELSAIKIPKRPPKPPQRIALADDVERLLATCAEGSILDRRDEAIIRMLDCTGMRRGECASLTTEHVSLETGDVQLVATKNGDHRKVALSETALRSVRRYVRSRPEVPDGYLWHAQRGHLSASGIGQMVHDRALRAGVDLSCHAFRRAFAVRWLRDGGSETYLRVVAGWKSPLMVAEYVRSVAEEEALREQRRLFGER
jgi:integrase